MEATAYMNNGWIKLHRSLLANDAIFRSAHTFTIWCWLLLMADKETGVVTVGRLQISDWLKIKPSTVYQTLKRLEKYNSVNLKSNNKMTTITIKNWMKYQSNPKPEDEQYNNNITTKNSNVTLNKNKNKDIYILSNDNMDTTYPKGAKDGKYGNEQVNLVLSSFRNHIGHIPTDSKPRNVAQNFRQLINTFVKTYGADYRRARNKPLEFEFINQRFWRWYMKFKWAAETQNLGKAKDYLKQYLDDRGAEIREEVKSHAGAIKTTQTEEEPGSIERSAIGAVRGVSEVANYSGIFTLPTYASETSVGDTAKLGRVLPGREAN